MSVVQREWMRVASCKGLAILLVIGMAWPGIALCATGTDTDGDGLADFDETTFYLTNPGLVDTDGDGLTDYEEVLAGTDPLVAASAVNGGLEVNPGGGFQITFTTALERTYGVFVSEDLFTNSWQIVSNQIAGTGADITVVDTNDSRAAGFYRVDAKLGLSGAITRDVWTGIPGFDMLGLTTNANYPDNPSFSDTLAELVAPTNWADSYGQRLHGFIHPPVTADYTFWISGDNRAELWLSTDTSAANLSNIAYTYATDFQQWDKAAAQQSSPISLVEGRKYFIEVLHKEATGDDHVSVAWQAAGVPFGIVSGTDLSEAGSQTPPSAFDDEYGALRNQSLNASDPGVLANDVDAEGDSMTAYMVSDAANGSLSLNVNGSFDYTPDIGFSGTDQFTYKAFDAVAGGTVATVSIFVENGVPVAVGNAYSTSNGVPLIVPAPGVLVNDSDPDDDMLAVITTPVVDVNNGVLTLSADGSFSYVPTPGFSGADYFTYGISDGTTSAVATVSLTVEAPAAGTVEVLDNGGFEDGTPVADSSSDLFDAPPWERLILNGNYNSWLTDETASEGTQSVEFRWGGTYIYQDFSATVGTEYTLSCESFQSTGNTLHIPTLQVEWYDSGSGQIGGTVTIDAVAAGTTGSWEAMSGTTIAPAGAVTGRVRLILDTESSGTRRNCYFDNVSISKPAALPIGTESELDVWTYESTGAATLTAVSQVAGHYAMADRESDRIEIRDIRGALLAEVTSAMITAAAGDLDLAGIYGPCSMAFTPSGRLLYIGVCSATGAGDKDAILLYNMNLDTLTVFDRLVIDASMTEPTNYGMVHYKAELFAGTENNLYRYAADRNATGADPAETLVVGSSVSGLAVDMAEMTSATNWAAKLYISTPSDLYRADPAVALSLGSSIATSSNIKGITFGRTYGDSETAGLYILRNDGLSSSMDLGSVADLRAGGAVSLTNYATLGPDLSDIAATSCGRMLLATPSPQVMSDASDARLDFESWLQDEFNSYATAVKSMNWPDGLVPEGFNVQKLNPAGGSISTLIDIDTAGWSMYCMLSAYLVNEDAEIEDMIVKMLKRNAGDYADGLGGVKTIDGVLYDTYDSAGNMTADAGTLYSMMKLLPAAYRAKDVFPANTDIATYQEYFRSIMKRSSDPIRPNMRLTWKADDHGPTDSNQRGNNESWIMVDIAAAQDPMCSQDYEEYLYDVDDITHPNPGDYLVNEPVLADNHSAFIIMGGSMILQNHRDMPSWDRQNRNYAAASMAVGDDMGTPYFTSFSAGNNPWAGGYNADAPTDHPGDIIHFPAVCGMGQYGWTSPVVGAYLAYRDGLRQTMQSSSAYSDPSMLTRWSFEDPTYVMNSVGIADFWFGMIGLGELLHPGLTDFLADDYYMPAPAQSLTTNNLVQLDYSKIAPRRIRGSNDGTNFVSYGFQLSPFVFEYGDSYAYYDVADAEGELLDLVNADFEDGLTGWMQTGDYEFHQPALVGVSIVGTSAEIRTTGSSTSAESSLSQTLNVSLDLEDTRYTVRADGSSVFAAPVGVGYLRIQWDTDSNAGNGVISTHESNPVSSGNERAEFRIDAQKPATANYMHVYLVSEMGAAEYERYIFDNVSLVRLGADEPQVNGDFETGDFSNWTENSSMINITSDPAKVLKGACSVEYSMGPGITTWQPMDRTIDMSGDPLGTRYIFRMDAKAEAMVDSDFEIEGTIYDSTNGLIITRSDLGDILPSTDGEITFTLRKRPEYDHVDLKFRMMRNSSTSIGTDVIIIDNFRLDREQLF